MVNHLLVLAASITFYLKEHLMCQGSFLFSHFSRNTFHCAALPGSAIPWHGEQQGFVLLPGLQGWWGKERLMLPVCPLVSWDSTKSRMEKKPPRKRHRSQVSPGMLPHCLWPRQSHLPAGTRCSTASSPGQFSIAAGVEVPGTLSCPLEPKRDFVKLHSPKEGELLGGRCVWSGRQESLLSANSGIIP